MPAILLSLLGFGKSALSATLSWLSHRSLAEIGCLVLALVCVVQTVRIEGIGIWPLSIAGFKAELAQAKTDLTNERNGRRADRQAYIKAQADAAAKNKAHVAEVERKQEQITDEVRSDLNSRLERIRRELRDNPAAKGSAGRSSLPQGSEAPCRVTDPAWLCLSPADRLRAAENEERHDRLIDWNERISARDSHP
jgi:hypothetical protein